MTQQPLLHIDDLHVHFNTSDGVVQAINGASLTLNPGEIVGLVGESGSGKSVTAMSILGLVPKPPAIYPCLLYTSPSPRDTERSRMPSSA